MSESAPKQFAPPRGPAPGEALARIVRNSAFNALGMTLILPFNFIALFTLARRLGKESLGTFFTIFAISAVIHWIADAGVSTVLTHRIARAPDQLRRIVGEAAGMLLLVALASVSLFYAVCLVWMLVAGGEFDWLVLAVAALAMVTRHTLDFASNAFRGLERFEFENLSRVLQTALFALFVWAGVYPQTGGVLAGFIAFMASNVVAASLIVTILVWRWNCTEFHLNRGTVRGWLRESLPLGIGDSVRRLIMQLDTLLLAAFRPPALVGLFSVAYRPLQPLQLLPRTIVSVTFPMMSRVAHSDRAALSRAFARTTNILWVASLPIALLTTACAAPLILATAGPDFAGAIWPLRILIWVAPLMFINAQLRFAFTALEAQRHYWKLICWALVIKLVAELVLIPLFGMYGACVGHVIGELALCAGGLTVLHAFGVSGPHWSQLLRVVPAAAAMAVVLIPVWAPCASLLQIAAYSLLSMFVYAALCLLTGAWPWSDVKQLWQVIARRATARRMTDSKRPSPARSELTADVQVDRFDVPFNASAAEPRLRGTELAKTQ
jgi:O-antigen/teichoic acid export membrane protein